MQNPDKFLDDSLKDAHLTHEIIKHLGEVFWLRDVKNEKILYINEAYETVWGRSCKSLYENPASFIESVHPDDLQKVQQTYATYLKTGKFEIEYRIVQPSGEVRWVQTRNIPIRDNKDQIVRDAGLAIDITAMKSTVSDQEQLSRLQEIVMNTAKKYINISLNKIDQNIQKSLEDIGGFVRADRAYVFDYDWEKEITINTYEWCNEGIEPQIEELQEVPITALSDWVEAHQAAKTMYIPDVFQLEEGNAIREILEPQDIKSLIAVPMMRNGECIGFVGFDSVRNHHVYTEKEQSLLEVFAQIMVNIQIRKELEDDLIVQKERAEMASQAKSDFLANMSHELRTPLNGVLGFADILKQTNLDANQSRYLDTVSKSALSLLDIINDILDFSKIEAGKFNLDFVETDLYELVEDSFEMIRYMATHKQLELKLDLDPNIPHRVITDPIRLRQLLVNLLSNAVKFTEKGSIMLRVLNLESNSKTSKVSFSVEDTGIGMSKGLIKRLYSAFDQGDNSATRKFGGTGLGLSISDHIVKKLGSTLEVESELEKGSVFRFNLTFEKVQSEEENEQKMQVLLVDDDEKSFNEFAPLFEEKRIQLVQVLNGLEAMQRISAKPTDFSWVLVKYDLPFLNGVESIEMIRKKLKELTSNIPFSIVCKESERLQIPSSEIQKMGPIIQIPQDKKQLSKLIDQVLQWSTEEEPTASELVNDDQQNNSTKAVNAVKILIVEDNESNRYLVETLIRNAYPSATILQAINGKEGYLLAENKCPDVIIMDVQMPVMDGIEATKRIRASVRDDIKDIPIIGLTAGVQSSERKACLQAGMDGFLTKPVDISRFVELLSDFLKK